MHASTILCCIFFSQIIMNWQQWERERPVFTYSPFVLVGCDIAPLVASRASTLLDEEDKASTDETQVLLS